MSGGGGPGGRRRVGLGWMLFLATPPLLVVLGLAALFLWQGSKGGVRGKWQKGPVPTNAVAPAVPPGGPERRR